MGLSPSMFTCCYSKTVAESYDRCSSSSRRPLFERSHHTSNARSAPAADRLSYEIQNLQQRTITFNSDGYILPRSKTEFNKRAFCVTGPTAWNELSLELRHMSDIHTFKHALKIHLFNVAYDNWVLNLLFL